MRCLLLTALTLLSVIPLCAQAKPAPEKADEAHRLVSEGTQFLTSGNDNAALENFRKAFAIAPTVEAITGMARAESLKPGLRAQAQSDYETALAIEPTADLYAELALFFYRGGDYRAAMDASKKALGLNPQSLNALMVYGNALSDIGDFDDAIKTFSQACVQAHSVHPEANGSCGVWQLIPFLAGTSMPVASSRGWAYFSKAERKVEQSNRVDCQSLSLAEKDFAEAVSIEPDDAGFHSRLADVLMGQGLSKIGNCAHSDSERQSLLDRAWSEYRIALNLDNKNVLDRGAFVALSQVLKRTPEYNGGVATEPDKSELSHWLADHPTALAKTGSAEPAEASHSLESLQSLADKALNAERSNKVAATQDAVTSAKDAIRAQPTDGFAWGKLGQAYFELGDYKNAEVAIEKSVEIFTEKFKNRPNPLTRELELMSQGQTKEKATATAEAEDRQPLEMLAIYWGQLANISDKLHKRRDAERYRDKALRAFEILGMVQSSSTAPPAPQTPKLAPRPIVSCPPPVHEICQGPPYGSSDWRDYNRCQAGNRREDARYQQCSRQ